MMKQILLLVITLIFFSCNASNDQVLNLTDSINIFKMGIDSKLLADENSQYADTLFIIKNKNYHPGYPSFTKRFKLIYIENLEDNKTLNKSNLLIDKRERVEVTAFSSRADTTYLIIYNHGFGEGYKFKLVKKNNTWVMVSESMVMN